MENFENSNELYHYGRKGMRWGQHIFGSDRQNGGSGSGKKGSGGKSSGSSKSGGSSKSTSARVKAGIAKGKSAVQSAIKKIEAKKKAHDDAKAEKEKAKQAEAEAKRKAEVEKIKSEAYNSKSAKAIYDNAELFTTKELQDALTRLQTLDNINRLSPKEVNKGKTVVEKVDGLVTNGTKLYNHAARIYNTFNKSGNSIPLIKDNDDRKEKTKKAKEDAKRQRETDEYQKGLREAALRKANAEAYKSTAQAWEAGLKARTATEKYTETHGNYDNTSASDYTTTSRTSAGRSIVSNYLSLPAPKDDD